MLLHFAAIDFPLAVDLTISDNRVVVESEQKALLTSKPIEPPFPQHFKSGPGRFCQFEYADHENHRQKCPMAVCLEYVGSMFEFPIDARINS